MTTKVRDLVGNASEGRRISDLQPGEYGWTHRYALNVASTGDILIKPDCFIQKREAMWQPEFIFGYIQHYPVLVVCRNEGGQTVYDLVVPRGFSKERDRYPVPDGIGAPVARIFESDSQPTRLGGRATEVPVSQVVAQPVKPSGPSKGLS